MPGLRTTTKLASLAFWIVAAVAGVGNVEAAAPVVSGTPSGQILAAGDRQVMILSAAGEVLWQYPTKLTHDVWMLSNGNILFADGDTVTEVTSAKKVVWQYKSPTPQGGGTYSCQRLANGNTVIGENSTGKILEVDAEGKIVFTLQTEATKLGQHQNLRMVRKLENGNYLVCHSGARVVKEYSPKGEVVWESRQPGALAFAAIRTPQGTTLVSSLSEIIEYDAAGKPIWECSTRDLADGTISNLTGMHLSPNGNIVTGCYQAYKDGKGCGLLEITREKRLVWSYAQPLGDKSMMAVQMLTADGKSLPGTCLR
jgi:hypothetical protein